jgi:hypothetical protein
MASWPAAKKDEFPTVDLALMPNHLIDLFQGKYKRGVFQTVRQNDDQDFVGTLLLRRMIEPFADRIDRPLAATPELQSIADFTNFSPANSPRKLHDHPRMFRREPHEGKHPVFLLARERLAGQKSLGVHRGY